MKKATKWYFESYMFLILANAFLLYQGMSTYEGTNHLATLLSTFCTLVIALIDVEKALGSINSQCSQCAIPVAKGFRWGFGGLAVVCVIIGMTKGLTMLKEIGLVFIAINFIVAAIDAYLNLCVAKTEAASKGK